MDVDDKVVQLYSQRILQLAASVPNCESLKDFDARAKARSPLCGSTVTVELKVNKGRICNFAQNVKACALGQASAAIVGKQIVGRNYTEIKKARDQLADMLKHGASPPDEPFNELKVLLPARYYKNRHASILLVLDATLNAFCQIDNCCPALN